MATTSAIAVTATSSSQTGNTGVADGAAELEKLLLHFITSVFIPTNSRNVLQAGLAHVAFLLPLPAYKERLLPAYIRVSNAFSRGRPPLFYVICVYARRRRSQTYYDYVGNRKFVA